MNKSIEIGKKFIPAEHITIKTWDTKEDRDNAISSETFLFEILELDELDALETSPDEEKTKGALGSAVSYAKKMFYDENADAVEVLMSIPSNDGGTEEYAVFHLSVPITTDEGDVVSFDKREEITFSLEGEKVA